MLKGDKLMAMSSMQKYRYPRGSILGEMFDIMDAVMGESPLNTSADSHLLPIDVYDSDDVYTVVAAIPGISPDEVDIRFEDGYLFIDAFFDKNYDGRFEGKMRRKERTFGKLHRKIKMPTGVSGQGITADYDNGLLILGIPKPEASRPYSIPIRQVSKLLEGVTS